jgi:hypothetical protein
MKPTSSLVAALAIAGVALARPTSQHDMSTSPQLDARAELEARANTLTVLFYFDSGSCSGSSQSFTVGNLDECMHASGPPETIRSSKKVLTLLILQAITFEHQQSLPKSSLWDRSSRTATPSSSARRQTAASRGIPPSLCSIWAPSMSQTTVW